MPDIPATTAIAASTSATTSGGNSASGNNIVVEVSVNSVPDKIQQLARQIEVSGTIAQTPADNTVILNTALGPLTFLLPQLAQGQQDKLLQQLISMFENQKQLTVMLQPGNPPSQALLLLPQPGSPQSTTSGLNLLQSSTATQTAPQLLPNAALSAIVLPNDIALPSGVSGQQAGGTLNQNPGFALSADGNPLLNPANAAFDPAAGALSAAPLETELIDVALAKLQGQPLPGLTLPQNQTSSPLQSFAGPQGASSGTTPALLQPGTELNLNIDEIIPTSAQGAVSIPIPQSPNQILATVAGNGPGGQLILKAGDATLYVRQQADLPVGTQLLLTVTPARDTAPALLTLPPDRQDFASLQQILAAIMQVDPAAARSIIAAHIPQPGESMPGALLFFLSAVRQGDVRNWLGSGAIDLLTRAGKLELLGKLAQDLQQAGQPAHDNVVGEWRSYPVPVQNNNQFSIMHFYVHGDRQNHSSPQGDKVDSNRAVPGQIRFLIDVRMSRLGAMQLDGFLRLKQLDIIVRSEQPLPAGLDQELRESYTNTLSAIGYTGALGFQTGRQSWLNIQKQVAGKAVVT